MAAQLSLGLCILPDMSAAESVRWASEAGYGAVEISRAQGPVLLRSEKERRELLEAARANDVRLASLHAWGYSGTALRDSVTVACELPVEFVVSHLDHGLLEQDRHACLAELREAEARCADHGIVFTIENSGHEPLEPFVAVFDELERARFTLDVKHAYKPDTLGLNHDDYLDRLADRLHSLHILGVAPDFEGLGDQMPPGADAIDWKKLGNRLAAQEFSGTLTVEISGKNHLSRLLLLILLAIQGGSEPGRLYRLPNPTGPFRQHPSGSVADLDGSQLGLYYDPSMQKLADAEPLGVPIARYARRFFQEKLGAVQ